MSDRKLLWCLLYFRYLHGCLLCAVGVCQITDVGVVALVPSTPNLIDLNLIGTGVTDATMYALRQHCPRLQSMHAKGCDFGLPNGAHLKARSTVHVTLPASNHHPTQIANAVSMLWRAALCCACVWPSLIAGVV